MTIVKELNELAERMTGTNPKATTDAQAMNYIEQNYNGGGSGGGNANIVNIDLDDGFLQRYFMDTSKYGQLISITNENDLATIQEMLQYANQYTNTIFRITINTGDGKQMIYGLPVIYNGTFGGIDFNGFMITSENVAMFFAHAEVGQNGSAIRPYVVTLGGSE